MHWLTNIFGFKTFWYHLSALVENGNAVFTRAKVKDCSAWQDYVSDRNYKSSSLPYIKEIDLRIQSPA